MPVFTLKHHATLTKNFNDLPSNVTLYTSLEVYRYIGLTKYRLPIWQNLQY